MKAALAAMLVVLGLVNIYADLAGWINHYFSLGITAVLVFGIVEVWRSPNPRPPRRG